MAQLSIVNLKSDNPKYPQNNINVTVDNDLSPETTVVIPNTFFPYIVEFSNLAEAVGKRYMSDWLYRELTETHYTTPLGKVLFNLDKSISAVPYYTLDYQVFRDMVADLRNRTVLDRGVEVSALEYVGASINDFNMSPDYLLRWLDFPIANGKGEPINQFPLLIGYSNRPVLDIVVEISSKKDAQDFYSNEYFVDVNYDPNEIDDTLAEDSYDAVANTVNESLTNRKLNRERLQSVSKRQSLDRLLKKAEGVTKTISGVGVAAAAISSAAKLLQSPPKIPKLPKLPRIALAPIIKKVMSLKKKNGSERKKKGKARRKEGASDVSGLSANAKAKVNKLQKASFSNALTKATQKFNQINPPNIPT